MKNFLRLLILCVLLLPSLAQATVFFDSDFETTVEADGWTSIPDPGGIQLSTANALSGAQSKKDIFRSVNGTPGGGVIEQYHTPTTHLFVRFGVKVDPTFTIGSNQFTKLLRWYTDTAHTTFMFLLANGNKQYVLHMENVYGNTDNFEFATGVTPSTTGFDELEGEVLLNTPGSSNGLVRVWVNGTLRIEALNLQIVGPTPTSHCNFGVAGSICASDAQFVRASNYVQSGLGAIYYDRIATGNARIGMVGSPPPTDTTPPSPAPVLTITADGSATWTASSDNVGVTNYTILSCATDPCTPAQTVTNTTNLFATVSQTGDYGVWANDLAGNHSLMSNVVTFTAPTTFKTTLGTKNWSGVADGTDIGTDFDAGYTGRNNLKIVSTYVSPTVLNADSVESYNAVDMTTHDDQWCQVTLGAITGAVETDMGCFVRIANAPTPTWYACFAVHGGANSSAIVESNNGVTGSLVLDNTVTWAQGDKMRCEAQGTALRLYRIPSGSSSDTLVTSMTDATITSGKTGIYGYVGTAGTLTNGAIADFAMGGFAVTPPTPPTVASLTTDATGFNETDTGSPTSFRLQYGDNNCNSCTNITILASEIVAGRYNITWPQGTQFACLYARDALGTENTDPNGYVCNTVTPGVTDHGPATGVRSQLTNTPWFTDASLKGLYFAGHSGIFNTVQDYAENGSTTPINLYPASTTALDAEMASLQSSGVNFIRMFVFDESATGSAAEFAGNTYQRVPYTQMPWKAVSTRSDASSGTAITVGVFDLSQFNQTFFDKTRAAVISALNHNITPSVMLFYGWAKFNRTYGGFSHPFWSANNVNGVSCDTNADLQCDELHNLLSGGAGQPTALQRAQILALQDAYIHKMIDTLNDIDGFIWEVNNEDEDSTQLAWQDRVADVITAYEATGGRKVHPVWNTGMALTPDNAGLLANAHVTLVSLICDGVTNYDTNPPAWASGKIILYDSDHTGPGGVCGTEVSGWPWKEFTRGYHTVSLNLRESGATQTLLIQQMAQTVTYAKKIHLAGMLPVTNSTIINSGYGLKEDCKEYLMFMPANGSNSINLTSCGAGTTFSVEFLNIRTGVVTASGNVAGGATRSWNPAGTDMMVVYVKNITAPPADTTPPLISAGSPTGVLPSGTTSYAMQVNTNEAATCKYGTVANTAYASIASTFTTTGDTIHSQTISVSDGNTYTYYIRCQDTAGNANLSDYTISWSVSPTPPPPDVDPPVRSNGAPTGELSSGTTSVPVTLTTDENATCKYDSRAGIAYASMTNTFSTTGTTDHLTVISGLIDNAVYAYYVRCVDGSSNANTTDYVISWSIAQAPDTTPPTVFGCTISGQVTGSVLPIGTTSAVLQCFTDENATLKYGSAAGIAYAAQPNTFSTTGTTTHSVSITGLTNGGSYTRYIRGIDGSSNASTSDTTISWTVGQQTDLTPPVMSNPLPNTTLPAGTTSTTISLSLNESASCKWDTTDTTYALMANTMTTAALTASATVGSLTDDSTTLYYTRCQDVASPTPNTDTTSLVITVIVAAAAGDVTAPTAPSNLVATPVSQTQVSLTWTAGTDANGIAANQVFLCFASDCSDAALVQTLGNTTTTIVNLAPNTTYYFEIKALDPSNNASSASNIATATTPPIADVVPPSTMTDLQAIQVYSQSAVLTWTQGTDDRGAVTTTIELCVGTAVSCTDADYTVIVSKLALNYLVVALNPSTTYTARGKFSDGTNLSVAYSNLAQFTTLASGLPQPRVSVPFPGRSSSGARSSSGTRLPRP